MDPKTSKLLSLLDQTIGLLDRCKEAHWSRWLDNVRKQIESRDFSGITALLGAFGGMGSFNDLVIHPRNGHNIEDEAVAAVNEKLDGLRGSVFEVADEIKREMMSG